MIVNTNIHRASFTNTENLSEEVKLCVTETECISPLIKNFSNLKFKPPLTIPMKNWIDFRVIAVFHAKGHIVINNKYNVAQLSFLCELLVM